MGVSSGLTRRELVKQSAIATAAVSLAACFPTSSNAPSGSPAAAKPSPVRGGTLSWGQWDSNDDIDPANPSGSSASEIDGNIMDTLVAMGADQKIYPLLATKWEMTPDGKKYTFTLRDGVKFHDGTAFDARSIKRSWERMLDPKLKAAANASLLGPIESLAAPDARTFVVTYKDSYPLLLLYIWHPWYGPLSNAQLDTLKPGDKVVQPVGTGPYKVTGRSADGVWTLAANSFRSYFSSKSPNPAWTGDGAQHSVTGSPDDGAIPEAQHAARAVSITGERCNGRFGMVTHRGADCRREHPATGPRGMLNV